MNCWPGVGLPPAASKPSVWPNWMWIEFPAPARVARYSMPGVPAIVVMGAPPELGEPPPSATWPTG